MVKKDIPQRRSTDGNHRWQSAENIARIISIVFLAWIAYQTKVSGDNASIAAAEAQRTAVFVPQLIAQQDTIQHLVDGTKSRLDTLVFGLQEDNTKLREQLRRNGITPVEPKSKVNP